LFIGGSIIIIVELNEKEDPVTSIGQSTTEDLFPEIKYQIGNVNRETGRICLLEMPSACVHLTYCMRNVVRGIEKLGFYNKEARQPFGLQVMKLRACQKVSWGGAVR
jgi:hypothetical protein